MTTDQKMETKPELQYHIITLGCQMNKNDSERLESILLGLDMNKTENPGMADLIVMNSCSVRKSAEDRIYGLSQKFLEYKKNKPDLIVCVTGCMPGRDKDGKMKAKLNGVDLYFPTKDMVYLPKWLSELNPNLRSMENIEKDYLQLRPSYQKSFQAFVTIQTGCNHFCTYCVVPFSRGLEQNRSLRDILDEIRELADKGCLEITLLGQIVNHYIAPDPRHFSSANPYSRNDFAKLLWEINQIPGIDRVHFTAPHPLYMDEEAVDALGLPKQVNYIHLPVQSGNDEILKKMNRRHDREYYIQTVDRIREKHPAMAIGTDIIVGFCGETEAMFQDTVSLYQRCDFDISYNAQYSPRSGTVSYKVFQDTVSKEEKKRRWWILQNLMEKRALEKNQAYKGTVASVLVDQHDNGWCKGNSREMKRAHFQGDESDVGKMIPILLERCEEWVLWGKKYKSLS
ncbi:MAG: MiaB/RimO family radical SAM methylthiotransferase [Candidatus Magasanikbacteria bacterium]|nr:MiaB/RimO family radical SAM methylthiotransferase [Candidatus Magasanikbacteria bacterium]